MKKKLSVLLSFLLSMTLLAGCKGNESSGSSSSSENQSEKIKFWSASTAETVLLGKDISVYEGIQREAKIDVDMAQNEYEGAQIFMTALDNVSEYFVDVADLKSADGTKFASENIDVYAYKYTEVTANMATHRGGGIGDYPDAILPIEASVKFGENNIAKGNNQGIYVRFKTTSDTPAGLYTGSLTVRYDGESKNIPITVNVWDVEVSETTHSKTLFSNGWHWKAPELDSTDERFQSYIDLLSEYRIGSIDLMEVSDRDKSDPTLLTRYTDKVYEYVKNPKNSTYAINYFLSGTGSFDTEMFEKFIIAIAEKSFATNYNCLTKATAYFGMLIDEATMQGKFDETVMVTNDYRSVLQASYEAILANKSQYIQEYGITEEFVDEIANSAASIPHIFVSNYNADYAPYIDQDATGTGEWCPNVWEFQDDVNVAKFMEIDLDWWYGCGGSSRPIPGYQLDDYTLSPRLMSWQQIYYGIEGNLYWATNINQVYSNGAYTDKEDYYDQSSTWAGVTGDGQLVYPGGQYELDAPVATRRLEAIRDGLEEYELLLALKNKYSEVALSSGMDFSFDTIYEFVTSELFDGININATASAFDASRKLILQLLSLADSDANACITDFEVTTTQIVGKCYVADGYTVQLNGEALSGEKVNGGTVYTFSLNLDDYKNVCVLSIPELVGYNSLTIESNGKAIYYAADTMFNGFKDGYVDIEKELVSANAVSGAWNEQLVKVNVEGLKDSEGLQGFKYSDDLIKKLGEATSSMSIRIYNGSGATQRLSIEAKYKGDPIIRQLAYAELAEGWNTIEIKGINQKIWKDLISIDYMLFIFDANDQNQNPAINNLYFDGYYITYLKEVN